MENRTFWQEFDVNQFLYNLESIKYYENEMIEEAENKRFYDMAKRMKERHIKSLQRTLRSLKGTDFTAALDLIKEMFPGRHNDISGIFNF